MNVTVPSSGQFGFIPDAQPQELPVNAWSYVRNGRFRDGYAEKFRGESLIFTAPSVTPYFLMPYRNLNSKLWIHAGTARVYVDDGANRFDLTPASPFAGGVDDRWTGGVASGVAVLNNGIDLPQFWGGNTGTPFAPLTGWNVNWRAASVRPFKNYLVALNVTKSGTQFPYMVKWSAAASPGAVPSSWDETDPTKDAGEQDMAETTDTLVDQLPLGDINVLYKERSMYGMQYIGGTFVFRFYKLPGDVGMLARGCAAQIPLGHVVLTAGDLILHNGQGPQSIVNARTRRWLFNSIDPTNYQRSFLCVNRAMNEVWVCFPENGQASCTAALVWNFKDDTFGVRSLANVTYGASGPILFNSNATWASDSNAWNTDTTSWNSDGFGGSEERLLITTTAPQISLTETGTQIGGQAASVTFERTGMAFDKPYVVKTVKSVVPRIDASVGTVLTIQVGASMDSEQAPVYSAPVTYTVGSTRKADLFATGRFLALRIMSSDTQPFRLRSFDLEIDERGRY